MEAGLRALTPSEYDYVEFAYGEHDTRGIDRLRLTKTVNAYAERFAIDMGRTCKVHVKDGRALTPEGARMLAEKNAR
jgi:hypothetical protein